MHRPSAGDDELPLARARRRLERRTTASRGRRARQGRPRGQAPPARPASAPHDGLWALLGRPFALEGLGARVARVIATGHRFDHDLGYDPARCGCAACLDCDGLLAELRQPETREASAWLLEQARAYQGHLWRLFEAVCFTSGASARAAAEVHARACHRLADELGVPLTEQVRRMVLRSFGDRHGACPFCAVGVCAAGERGS